MMFRSLLTIAVMLSIFSLATCGNSGQQKLHTALTDSSSIRLGDNLNSLDRRDVRQMAWSPNGRFLAIYAANPLEVLFWDTITGDVLWRRPIESGPPHRPLSITGDGRFVITSRSRDDPADALDILVALDASTGARVTTIAVPVGQELGRYHIQDAAASFDGKSFAVFLCLAYRTRED